MLVGVTLTRNTFMHGVEEWIDIPGRLSDAHTSYWTVLEDGTKVEVPSRRHIGHPSDNFDRILDTSIADGVVHTGSLGNAPVLFFKARAMAEQTLWQLWLNPRIFDDN